MTRENHPVADLFPMLADDELADLAADIKRRGQLHPIVLDADGRVLDGRNRLAACRLAGVEPAFSQYDGDDASGYALASNGQVRELTKAQKAVVGAKVILMSDSDIRDQDVASALRVGRSTITEAVTVARHSDLADRVLARVAPMPFSAALDEARARDRRKAEDEGAKKRLRADAPDLLPLVDEERMSLADAVAALDAREEKARREAEERRSEAEQRREIERDRRRRASAGFGADLVRLMSALDPDPIAFASRTWDPTANPHRDLANAREFFSAKGIRRLAEHLAALADHLEEKRTDLL